MVRAAAVIKPTTRYHPGKEPAASPGCRLPGDLRGGSRLADTATTQPPLKIEDY